MKLIAEPGALDLSSCKARRGLQRFVFPMPTASRAIGYWQPTSMLRVLPCAYYTKSLYIIIVLE